MITIQDKKDCCGCGACSAVCPVSCITMREDGAGFLFPQVDPSKCIGCDACSRVCPIRHTESQNVGEKKVFSACAQDKQVRFSGSSGGMFGTLARHVISMGGAVYGAAFDEHLQLKCRCATTNEELEPLYKSKYLQSDMREKFSEIQERLKSGQAVLFTATPCQVAALKNFLKCTYDHLFTVDLICHGVPSQSLFDRCVAYTENKRKIKIKNYAFRSKVKNAATAHYYTMSYEKNGKTQTETRLYTRSPFYLAFEKYITLRDSCYVCPYYGKDRPGDITIADFHTINRYLPEVDRFKGVSTVVLNSQKGEQLWNAVSHTLDVHAFDFNTLYQNGEFFTSPTKMPARRAEFIADLTTGDFDVVVKKFMNTGSELPKNIYYAMPKAIRKRMKNLFIGGD